MRIPRFIWPAGAPSGAVECSLDPDQARHAALVLRLKAGARVEMLSERGLAPAEIESVEDNGAPRVLARLAGPWSGGAGSGRGAVLAMALIQGARFDWVVEKSVELGAGGLIPLITERVKSGDSRPGEAKMKRWKRLAEEARKQCGRPSPLEIALPETLDDLLARAEDFGPAFFGSPAAEPCDIFERCESPLLLIGPEGGFSPMEEEKMLAAGFQPKSLGPLTLRAETAALAAIVMMDFSLRLKGSQSGKKCHFCPIDK